MLVPKFTRVSLFIAATLVCSRPAIAPSEVYATEQGKHCHVLVRVLEGFKQDSAKQNEETDAASKKVVEEMWDQLEALNYDSYRVVKTLELPLVISNKQSFTVRAANQELYSVDITPVLMDLNRVELSVDWAGESGEKLLSTALQIDSGSTMVVGTECKKNASTILSFKPTCGAEPSANSSIEAQGL